VASPHVRPAEPRRTCRTTRCARSARSAINIERSAGTAIALFTGDREADMKRFLSTMSLGLLAACGAGSDSAPDTAMPAEPVETDVPTSQAERSDICPLELTGTTQTVEDTVDGVVVLFATPRQNDLPDLRRRVERLADTYNAKGVGGEEDLSAAPPQGPGPVTNESGADSREVEVRASVEPNKGEEGVRLVLRPADPAQLDAKRDQLRKQADDLVQSVCDEAGRKNLH
jgi:hypothetical protein